MKSSIASFFLEFFLWNLANVVCIVLPGLAVYFVGAEVLGWSTAYLSFYLTAALLATLTWGSWASLVWTRNRLLRGGMQIMTLLPGVMVLAAGAIGLYSGLGAWYLWFALIGSSLGMMAVSVGLLRAFRMVRPASKPSSLVFGLILFPLAATVGGLVVGSLWYLFVTRPIDGNLWDLLSFATLMVTVLASALVTTVIPAVVSTGCRRMSCM